MSRIRRLAHAAEVLPASGIRVVMEAAARMEAHGARVTHLEVGQPDFAAPATAIAAAKRALDAGNTRYIANAGMRSLREAVAAHYAVRYPSVRHDAEQIVCTQGSMFAYASALLSTIEPDDEVLLPDPGYPNYAQTVAMLRGKPVYYPLHLADGWQPRLAELQALVTPKTKLLLLNSPSNPTGAVFPLPMLEQLWGFCKQHDLFCLADEVYADLVYDESSASAPSMLQCPGAAEDDRLMVVSGVSKSHAMTGFRTGWLRGSRELVAVVTKLQEPFISCCVPFAQVCTRVAIIVVTDAPLRRCWHPIADVA